MYEQLKMVCKMLRGKCQAHALDTSIIRTVTVDIGKLQQASAELVLY